MAVFKCKMCGGTLNIVEGTTVCECEYCGTAQTLPKLDNEKRNQLFDRANHYRMNKEFDKAAVVYENILAEAPDEAEAHWGMCLCRYGIEYVVDPKTNKRIPTCHRTQFRSILEDEDYLSAVKNCDGIARAIYNSEAMYIDSVQKKILEISAKEEPFDIFICYKESDNAGNRTTDSVIAQDIYDELTNKGYKVFFARITLEDKIGSAYEPYIFAALNSSKIMLVLGTKPEYFNAVWVKNEWSRYLSLIEQGKKKTLIPCYRDMTPYDLPDEFVALQSQDVSKVGYMQDLIRGIEKILGKGAEKTVIKETVIASANANTASLLKRAFMFLEDGDWDNADAYCEKVLDIEPECAQAYLGKLLVEFHINKEENLPDLKRDISGINNYQKAYRFGDNAFKKKLENYNKQAIYNSACEIMSSAKNDVDFRNAKSVFLMIEDFLNAALKADECEKMALMYLYEQATSAMNNAKDAQDFRNAEKIFEKISEYNDSKHKAKECEEKAFEYLYQQAVTLMANAMYGLDFKKAAEAFEEISGYKDSKQKAEECEKKVFEYLYQRAVTQMENARYELDFKNAAEAFEEISDYKDSEQKMQECLIKKEEARKEAIYRKALQLQNTSTGLKSAIDEYMSIEDYKDSKEQIERCKKRIKEDKERAEREHNSSIAKGKRHRAFKKFTLIIKSILFIGLTSTIFSKRVLIKEFMDDLSAIPLILSLVGLGLVVGFIYGLLVEESKNFIQVIFALFGLLALGSFFICTISGAGILTIILGGAIELVLIGIGVAIGFFMGFGLSDKI